ncbi:MAG: extracellular solute-binding protein [Lentisphaeria bacterium]|nr:extracellular solute-binding protein [Lentisphaeria bacterium]
MNKKHAISLVFVLVAMVALIVFLAPSAKPEGTLKLYAGAGLRRAVEKLVAEFERLEGVKIEPDYGGSGMVLSRAREDDSADLFMPGDKWYVQRLEELSGKVETTAVVARFVPVIIVPKGNPRGIQGLADFRQEGLTVGLGRAKACQIGRLTDKIFAKAGLKRETLAQQESLTVNELGVWVKMKTVDAAIVWDAIASNIATDVDVIPIEDEWRIESQASLAVLETAPHPESARAFVAFVTSPEGRGILKAAGYTLPE